MRRDDNRTEIGLTEVLIQSNEGGDSGGQRLGSAANPPEKQHE